MNIYPLTQTVLTLLLVTSGCSSSPTDIESVRIHSSGKTAELATSKNTAQVSQQESELSEDQVRGEYLVTILGCGGCHTEGALERLPYGTPLAGSKVGIAYSAPEASRYPSVVFASNLTSHKEHGLGSWSSEDIGRAIRSGINHQDGEVVSVMPWINYSLLNDEDTNAIVAFLRSLPAVANKIPANVSLGQQSEHAYVRIGVYRFTPEGYEIELP